MIFLEEFERFAISNLIINVHSPKPCLICGFESVRLPGRNGNVTMYDHGPVKTHGRDTFLVCCLLHCVWLGKQKVESLKGLGISYMRLNIYSALFV